MAKMAQIAFSVRYIVWRMDAKTKTMYRYSFTEYAKYQKIAEMHYWTIEVNLN
jgi:hypothetical protein